MIKFSMKNTLLTLKLFILLCASTLPALAAGQTSSNTIDIHTPTPSLTTIKPITCYPTNQKLYELYPNGVLYYYGVTVSDALMRVFAGNFHRWPEHIQSLEMEHTLSQENIISRIFNPLVGLVQVAGNISVRQGSNEHTIYEFNPFLLFRWANLPWNRYVVTSLGIGEGLSYDTSIAAVERKDNSNNKRLLNYLMFEATFANPQYPRLQLVARIHHRSGAYGLYHAGNGSTNNVGLGIRYLFD
jgi:hypothetical protein